MVNSNPPGADCGLYRQNIRIATVQNAPGSALIEKTKYDIWVACVKSGYQMATYYNHSGAAGATWGNIIAGGGIGWAIDSATGPDNKYESPVNITLVPNVPGQVRRADDVAIDVHGDLRPLRREHLLRHSQARRLRPHRQPRRKPSTA